MNITRSYLQQYNGRTEPPPYSISSNWVNVLGTVRPQQEMTIRLLYANITSYNMVRLQPSKVRKFAKVCESL